MPNPNTFKVYDVISSKTIKTISLTAKEFSKDSLLFERLASEGIFLDASVVHAELAENGLSLKVYNDNQIILTIENA